MLDFHSERWYVAYMFAVSTRLHVASLACTCGYYIISGCPYAKRFTFTEPQRTQRYGIIFPCVSSVAAKLLRLRQLVKLVFQVYLHMVVQI